jgi:hypothetical protein
MSIKTLLKHLDEVRAHPETPIFISNERKLSTDIARSGIPGMSEQFRKLVDETGRQVDAELRNDFCQINDSVAQALRRNGYQVHDIHQGHSAKTEIVYPGNRFRLLVG